MFYISSFLLFCFSSCNDTNKEEASKAESDVDAVRSFIRSTMDGEYEKAKTYMLADSQNLENIGIYERYYKEKMKPEEKQNYKNASINIHEIKKLNDSTTIVFYSNSFFKADTHQLKSIRLNNQWLVDFKSYFPPKKDSLP